MAVLGIQPRLFYLVKKKPKNYHYQQKNPNILKVTSLCEKKERKFEIKFITRRIFVLSCFLTERTCLENIISSDPTLLRSSMAAFNVEMSGYLKTDTHFCN